MDEALFPTLPLLLTKKQAAQLCGLSIELFNELILPRTTPVRVRADARWTESDLRDAVALLQQEAKRCRSGGGKIVAAGSFTSRSPASRRSAAPSAPPSPEPKPTLSSELGAPSSSKGKTRLLLLMPGDRL